jgi:hypothetical protein
LAAFPRSATRPPAETCSWDRRCCRHQTDYGPTAHFQGDRNLATQIKLLQVLQEREFERLGGTETIRTNILLIAPGRTRIWKRRLRLASSATICMTG